MKNKEYFAEKRKRNRDVVEIIKTVNKCSICEESRPYVLDFHHTDATTKRFTIASASTNTYSLECIVDEMRKCSCLCANCHRELHFLNIEKELSPVVIPDSVLLEIEESKMKSIGTGGYVGVSLKSGVRKKKFYVCFKRKDFKMFTCYLTAEEAARCYDSKILELDGPDAITNKKLGLLED